MNNYEEQLLQKRNAELEIQLADKKIELQRKSRELEIEAALEVVRSRTMSMHKSEEMQEVVDEVFIKLKELEVGLDTANILIVTNNSDTIEIWTASQLSSYSTKFLVPIACAKHFSKVVDAIKNNKNLATDRYNFEEKNDWFTYLFEHTDYKYISEDRKRFLLNSTGLTVSVGISKNIGIQLNSYSREAFTEEENSILKRFTKIFEQSYTRFLDLQNAEAQAREAEIQLALEKVRARTMAMRKSDELPQAANLLFQQIQSLGMPAWSAGYCIWDEDKKGITLWMSSEGVLQPPFKAPLTEDPSFIHMREAYERGENFFVDEIGGEELVKHYQYMRTLPVVGEILDSIIEAGHPLPTFQIFHLAYFSQGFLLFITYEPLPEAHDIFKRFAIVFEQTYTRFLDLQNAEAQAREAEIQLALERVRARTMAMQHSEELKDAAALLFQQAKALGVPAYSCGYNIWEKDEKEFTSWMSTQDGSDFNAVHNIPLTEDANFIRFAESREKGEQFFVLELRDQRMQEHYQYLKTIPAFKAYFDYAVSVGFDLPKTQIHHIANFSQGNLLFITLEPCLEFHDVFKRFAAVFEQTYIRFLDLQKAEAQAREAEIELALERVRARTMAMQRSEELRDAASVLFQQAQALGARSFACGFSIWGEGKKTQTYWMSQESMVQPPFTANSREDVFHDFYKAAERGESLYVKVQEGKELEAHYRYMATIPVFKGIMEKMEQKGLSVPTFQILHCAFFSQGFLLFITYEPVQEIWDVFKRFAKVFEQTYTRFLDLQKAEAQAREAQIEAALERVRAKAMAMHKTKDLDPAVAVVFEELEKLDIGVLRCGISVLDKEKRTGDVWVTSANKGGSAVQVSGDEAFDIHPLLQGAFDAWLRQEDFYYVLKGDDLAAYYNAVKTARFQLPESQFIFSENSKSQQHCFVAVYHGGGLFAFLDTEFSDEAKKLMKRFAAVFDLTYKRFVDLQKAEAQAREAEIELALERIRAKTMAMQHQNDLLDVTDLLAEQLLQLGFDLDVVNFSNGLSYGDWDIWVTAPTSETTRTTSHIIVPWIDHPYFQKTRIGLDNFKKGVDLNVAVFTKEEKDSFLDHLLVSDSIFKNLPDKSRAYLYSKPGFTFSAIFLKDTWVTICKYDTTPFTDEQHTILRRAAHAFGQAYTRFLDLRKAEAQARQAQIEAAMEKVRSRSLAMHKSEELQDVVHTVFERLKELNVDFYTVIIIIFQEGSKDILWWLENKEKQQYPKILLPYSDNPYLKDLFQAKQDGKAVFSKCYSFKEKNELFYYLFNDTDFKYVSKEQKKFLLESEFATMSVALAEKTGIHITSYSRKSFSEEDSEILRRFSNVFDQAYTRFLDLKKAEAQARESQIEAALEKIRSTSLAMHHSDEIVNVVAILFEKLKELGLTFDGGAGIILFNEGSRDAVIGVVSPEFSAPTFHDLPYDEDAFLGNPIALDTWRGKDEGADVINKYYSFEEKNRYFKYVFKHNDEAKLPKPLREFILNAKSYTATNIAEKNSLLVVNSWTEQLFSEENIAVLRRVARVFEQAYVRFLDLKKAEAQAQQAIKQASVDRVRAEIASMRTTNDLERITPLIWNELTTLGVPFIRCGVFIMDEEKQQIETHLSTPDGESIAAFKLPYTAPGEPSEILAHWRKKELYKQHWNETQFVEFTQNLSQQGAITSGEEYLRENHPTDLYLHFLPFLQGMLYAGNTSPLSDDELQLMQNLADAFSTAYARYEDFNKLEAAKKQVDSALNKLQATQRQLIQSEKMASLGELTAGIAHEIQNPLNFVNNFSEVNEELISELLDEVDKRNYDEVKAIANNIKENGEKIGHHGKRADAIVKGMLQHSRTSNGQKEPTDINALADEYLRLSYHGMRAKDKSFNAKLETNLDATIGKINIVPQDIGRVLLNLFNNAIYAVNEKQKAESNQYVPLVTVVTKKLNGKIEIRVSDNGNGIPKHIVDKIFQPFFTTKPTGQGTGLGLSLSYDIIKAHGGEVKVETKEGAGSEFMIHLPVV